MCWQRWPGLAGHTQQTWHPRELRKILSLPVTEMGSVLLQAKQVQNDSKMLDVEEVMRVEAEARLAPLRLLEMLGRQEALTELLLTSV